MTGKVNQLPSNTIQSVYTGYKAKALQLVKMTRVKLVTALSLNLQFPHKNKQQNKDNKIKNP